jgi:hypothetical protein
MLILLSTQSATLIDILIDMEMVLASDRRFLLGNWVRDALQFAMSEEEIHFYNFNAKLQISIWGTNYTLGLFDYASKFWSGMIREYVLILHFRKSSIFYVKSFSKKYFCVSKFSDEECISQLTMTHCSLLNSIIS